MRIWTLLRREKFVGGFNCLIKGSHRSACKPASMANLAPLDMKQQQKKTCSQPIWVNVCVDLNASAKYILRDVLQRLLWQRGACDVR